MIGPDKNGNLMSALSGIAEGDLTAFPPYKLDVSGKEQRPLKKTCLQAVSEKDANDRTEMNTASDGAAFFDPKSMMKLLKSISIDVWNYGEALDEFSCKHVLHNFESVDIVVNVNY